LNITPPCAPLPGVGQKLMSFLKTIAKTGKVNIYTAGHSLGGALAPSLTLALQDLRFLWDLEGNATFLPFAFAGPTPGDAAFAGYFQTKFPNLQRIWNKIDIVPHAWYTPQMKELPTLYGASVSGVADLVDVILPVIEPIGYTPLNDEGSTFTGQQQNPSITTLEAYLKEAAYQHTIAYLIWAGQQDWKAPSLTF